MRSVRKFIALGVIGLLLVAGGARAQTWVWNFDGDGQWTDPARWIGPGGYPDGVGHVADFARFNITTTRRHIRIEDADNLVTIGTLLIGDADWPYTFSNRTAHTTWVFADTDGLAEIIVSNAYIADDSRPHRIDGVIALSNNLRVAVLTPPIVPLFLWGAVTSDVAGLHVSKAGMGTLLVLTSAQWSGETRVEAGRLWLATNGVLSATSAVELRPGAGLILDNSGVNLPNRIPDGAPLRSYGGTFSFVHPGEAGVNYSETLGVLQLASGSLTVTSSPAASGQTSTLTFSSASRATGVVTFVSTAFGDTRNRIQFTTPPALAGATHSDIVPYMVARTNGGVGVDAVLVTHDGPGTPLRAYGTASREVYATAEANFVSTTNARPTSGLTQLMGARAVQALVLDHGANIAAEGANRILRVTNGVAGIILQTGGTSVFNPATAPFDVVLVFDSEQGIIYAVGTLELRRRTGSTLNTCIRATNGFIKAGPGDLVVSNLSRANDGTTLNNLRGVISIDEGRLIAQHANAFGGAVVMLNGGVLALMDDGNRKFTAQDVTVTNTPIIVQAAVGTVLVGRATSAATATRHTVGEITMRPGTTFVLNFTNLTGDTVYELIADGLRLEGHSMIYVHGGSGSGDGRLIITNQTLGGLTDGGGGYNLTVLGNHITRSEFQVRGTFTLGGNLFVSPETLTPVVVWADDGFTNVTGNITVGNGILVTPVSIARELGTGPGQIRFVNGYTAGVGVVRGGTVGVALTSGGATNMLTWGEGHFAVGSVLYLNEDDASGTLVLHNALDLNSTNATITRTILVQAGTAVLAGPITNLDSAVGVANLTKAGGGILIASNRLDHNGITTISGSGALRIPDPTYLSSGNLFMSAGDTTPSLDTAGVFTRGIGSGVNQVRILGSGSGNSRPGFSTWGGDLVLDFGGDGSGSGPALVWNSAAFDPDGPTAGNTGAFQLNRSDATNAIFVLNAIDLNGSGESGVFARRFEVGANVALLGGQIYNSGSGWFPAIGILKRGAGGMVLAADNTYDGVTVIEAGSLVVGINSTTGTLGLGNVTNAGTLIFNRAGEYTVPNHITGAGPLLMSIGSGLVRLSGANNYAALTVISNGILAISHGAALGATASGTVVAAGATLQMEGGITVSAEPLMLAGIGATVGGSSQGALRSVGGTNIWAAPILISHTADSALVSESGFLRISGPVSNVSVGGNLLLRGNADAEISGVISGERPLFKSGVGATNPTVWTLSGANTYSASTVIAWGTLRVSSESNLGVAPGSFVSNWLRLRSGLFEATATMSLGATRGVSMELGGGGFAVASGATLTVHGVVSGSATSQLAKVGGGALILTANSTHAGPVVVSNGTLRIEGHYGGGGLITVAGGRLEGNGSVAGAIDVLAGGALAPGASPGTFTANGNVTLQSGSVFEVELNGLAPGTGYDQLLMGTGTTLALSNPTLSVILGFSPNLGDTFQIVSGFSTRSGAFSGLPTSGSTFAVGSTLFQIDYNTSDITLTVIPEPATLSLLGLTAAVAVLLRRRYALR